MYSIVLSVCELLKHRKRSRFKIVRGINYVKYLAISAIENYIIRVAKIKNRRYNYRSERIIASLTTYPNRINECYYAIKSIFLQTYRPDEVILWLASSQFPDKRLPPQFNPLLECGLVVRYCEDLKSHKKYYHALQEQKQGELVITFDDDIVYHPKTIERAYKKHLQFPQSIVANEVHEIKLDYSSRSFLPYTQWGHPCGKHIQPCAAKYSIMTGSGCLYPFGIMPKQTFDPLLINSLALTADDLWITFMAMLNDVSVVPVDDMAKPYTTIKNSQKEHLAIINCLGTGNDDTIEQIMGAFPTIKNKLFSK